MKDVEKKIEEVMELVQDLMNAQSSSQRIREKKTLESKLRELLSSAQSGERESLRECAMCDLSYATGMLAGWNFCIADDESGFQNARRRLVTGAVAVLKELRGKHHTQAQIGEQSRATGWVAPKDKYVPPVLFNPYNGQQRDARDIQTDPHGKLLTPYGASMLAASQPNGEAANG